MAEHLRKYLRLNKLPHIWCPGCGHGTILNSVIRAIDNVGLDQEKTVVVSGIGCSSRATGYLNFNTLHTTHGRAIAFATGVKLGNPELNVIVLSGDGDSAAIGGNHLIHAARRNIDITTIVFNNSIYGMTSGQYSPLTPKGDFGTTAPYGNIDQPFDLCELMISSGATYVGRSTAYHARQLINLATSALDHKGFSFVEGISQCPTYYGRRNNLKTSIEMMKWQKEIAVKKKAAQKLSSEELESKIVIGELHKDTERPEYTAEYKKILESVQKEGTLG